jgi:hypothetical protein
MREKKNIFDIPAIEITEEEKRIIFNKIKKPYYIKLNNKHWIPADKEQEYITG